MSRSSVVVITSTVVVVLGSLVCLAFSALEFALPFWQPALAEKTPMMRGVFFFSSALFFAFAAWGISTAIGLMRRARWARFSMIAFGVLLLLFGAVLAVVMLLVPLPSDPNAPQNVNIVRM